MESEKTWGDPRLADVVARLESGAVRLLSLDVFDTLLLRRVPRPTDVFLYLGARLQEKGLLGPGIAPDSFAAARYQSEYAARGICQRAHGRRQVTLREVYEAFPRSVARLSVADLVEAELAAERDLLFANDGAIALAARARTLGIPFALVTNTVFEEPALRDLLRLKAPALPEPDALFVSCDRRLGKTEGLLELMLTHFGVAAEDALHVGDDPVTDRAPCERLGLPFVDVGSAEDFAARLADEHPIQWHERAARFAQPGGDLGLTALRRQASRWTAPVKDGKAQALFTYGATQMGPLLTGFAAWAAARASQEKAKAVFGLLREGALLGELAAPFAPDTAWTPLATSRLAATLASFAPGYPEHLEDFLSRRGAWTVGTLLAQLGFAGNDAAQPIGDPAATLEDMGPSALTARLLESPLADALFERSAAQRQALLLYLKRIGALGAERLFLLDLGYAATIQRALQRIFTIEKIPIVTHGLYLAAAHVSLATQAAGGIVEGFLAQNGNPNDFARAFCRSPEIVELACMTAQGSVSGYAPDGTPLFAAPTCPDGQHEETARLQEGVHAFAARFHEHVRETVPSGLFIAAPWRLQMRGLATRLVVYPSLEESRLLGAWEADSDLGLASPRPIVAAEPDATPFASLGAAELVAQPRRNVPWLYGIAVRAGTGHARRVASLMLRREPETMFTLTR